MRFIQPVVSAALAIFLIGGGVGANNAVEAKQLRYALGTPPNTPGHEAVKDYADAVERFSDGELIVKIYPLSLLSFAEASAGLRDGLADIAFLLTPYNPDQFPHVNYVSETSMLLGSLEGKAAGKEGMAFGAAVTEFIFEHCPECLAESAAQNQVYTGHAAGTSYGLLCSQPVRSVDELRGTRVRVGSSNFARWAEALGASPVTMSANEMREALSQGVVDCIALSTPEILNYSLGDLITDITMAVPGGVFPFAAYQVNRDTWQGLDAEEREAMLRAAAEGAAAISYTYYETAGKAMALVKDRGAVGHEAEPELVRRTEQFVEEDMVTINEQYAERYGVERGEEMMKTFRPVLEKWVELVKDVDTQDQLAELYWTEIMSEIDASTYGM